METRFYEAPVCEVIEVKFEGLICESPTRSLGLGSGGDDNVEDRQNGGDWGDGDWK